jgi:hypothetical protein
VTLGKNGKRRLPGSRETGQPRDLASLPEQPLEIGSRNAHAEV